MMLTVSLVGSAVAQPPTREMVEKIGLDQKLGAQVPLDLPLRDEGGRALVLGDRFADRPVILLLIDYECRMLCSEMLSGLLRAMRAIDLSAGNEFRVVVVSIDPDEDVSFAESKRAEALKRYGREEAGDGDGWSFLVGSKDSIDRLTETVGYRYTYDSKSKQYLHPSGVMLLTPEGKVSHYFYGIEYSAKDLRLALVESSNRRIGSPVDQLLLLCYHYDPTTGRYGLAIMNIVRAAGVSTALGLAAMVGLFLRRERSLKEYEALAEVDDLPSQN